MDGLATPAYLGPHPTAWGCRSRTPTPPGRMSSGRVEAPAGCRSASAASDQPLGLPRSRLADPGLSGKRPRRPSSSRRTARI